MALSGLPEIRLTPALSAFSRASAAVAASEFRISSGRRIMNIGDDTASVTAAITLQVQNSTLRGSLQNGAHATTLLQIASNGLTKISTILESLSALTASANETGRTSRQYALLDAQFQSQQLAIDTIATATSYNGAQLLDGTLTAAGAPDFQLSNLSGGVITLTIPSVTSASLFPLPVSLSDSATATSATTQVSDAQALVDDAIAKVAAYQLRIDAAEDVVLRTIGGASTAIDNLIGTDQASETASRTRLSLEQKTSAAVLAQAFGISNSLLTLVQ